MPDGGPPGQRDISLARCAVAATPGAVVFATLVLLWGFFRPDDLFIHLRFARNLAQLGEWSFNPGEPVAGATSPPWVLALAGLRLIGLGGAAPAVGLAVAGGLLLILVVTRMTLTAGPGATGLAILAGVVIAANHRLTLWSAGGMETVLVPLLLLAAWLISSDSRRGAILAGGLVGLATWARPDALPAAGVVAAWLLVRVPRGDRLPVGVAIGCAAGLGPLLSLVMTGSWLPITVAAKGLGSFEAELLIRAVGRSVLLGFSEGLPLVLAGAVAVAAHRSVRAGWWSWLPLVVAAATFPVGYTLNHASGGVEATGRYLAPWFALSCVAWIRALSLAPAGSRIRRWAPLVLLLTAAQSLALGWLHRGPVLRYHDYYVRSLRAAATWLHDNAERDALVFSGDIGVVGYLGGVRILDPAGIVNPEAPGWIREGRSWREVRRLRPDFAINPAWFVGFPVSRFDPVTDDVLFVHHHETYRWTPRVDEFTVVFRRLDWTLSRGDEGREASPED